MASPSSHLREEMASRLKYALRIHPDLNVRGWGIRDLTRAVAVEAKVSLKDDSGATWFKGAQPRDPVIAIALARVLEVDPGWLYFGEHSEAPAPKADLGLPKRKSTRRNLLDPSTEDRRDAI